MPKIIITNYGNRLNKGCSALLHSQIYAVSKEISGSSFSVFTYYPDLSNYIKEENIKFFPILCKLSKKNIILNARTVLCLAKLFLWHLVKKYFNKDIVWLRKGQGLKEYYEADVILNTGGDGLTEDYGTPVNIILNLLPGIIFGKPVIIYGETIGTFLKWYNRTMTKFLLSRARFITVREKLSYHNVLAMGIKNKNLAVTADPAFLLNSAPPQKVNSILLKERIVSSRPLVGLSVSKLFSRYKFSGFASKERNKNYLKIMAEAGDYIIEFLDCDIIFIPHVIDVPFNDDREVAKEIYSLMKNKKGVFFVDGEYTPEETKGIIGKCEFFIGARMHACIASASMTLPTISIAYSQKALGIMGEMLGLQDFVIDVKDMNFERLKSVIDLAWRNKNKIRKQLQIKIEIVKGQAMHNAKLIKKVISKKSAI